ncbi:MAG: UvrD-helicase domain-containing protein [Elusimicrobia bacterium]|nr:UvrD-helicase domain-containing protein [Elusimicrobiota bacterium]
MIPTADQNSRDFARKALDANIVVEAGAGTGKTTLLTDRLLFLLLAGGPERSGLSVTRIVALTFTEKAAGEIKLRLAERLNDLLSHLSGRTLSEKRALRTHYWLVEARDEFGASDVRLRSMAEEALRDLDRAPIGTIHGFCKTLIQLYPLEVGVNPQFKVDSGDGFDILFQTEWARWLEHELALKSPHEKMWCEVLAHVGLGDIAGLAHAMAKTPLIEPDPKPLLRRLADLREKLERLPEGKPKPRRGDLLESIHRIADRLRAVEQSVQRPDVPLPDPDEWKELPKKWPSDWAEFSGEALYKEACALANSVSPEAEAALVRVRKLLGPFVVHCRARYRAEGWMGFDDLLRGARDLLAHHPEVRRELKARFGAVLVDEFQDTDPLQGEMLLFLAERPESEATQWRDVTLAPGKLFIVGDPKQSIYRFRGADIRAYEAFVSLVIEQGGRKCDLQTSFRTHEKIVDPVNRLFSDLMQEVPGLQAAYLPLFPRPGDPSGGELELALVDNGTKTDGEETSSTRLAQTAEARWIARWIVDHCGPEGSDRPWTFGDVALLFRSTSPLTTYMEALKAAKIPYLVESDRAFYGTPEVMDFLNLLRVLDNPGDRVSLVGLLRSPLIMLEDRHLMALAEADALDDRRAPPPSLPADVVERLTEFYGMLERLRISAREEPLGALAARLLRDTSLLAVSAVAYHGEQSVSNLYKMARLAAEAGMARGESIGKFVRRVVRDVGKGVEEGESPLGEERTDAVRLLTVHKAKGLEFKVVMVPNLSSSVRTGQQRPPALRQDWAESRVGHRLIERKWADLGMGLMEIDERRREKEEAVRIFYVAATRARDHVIFVGNEKAARGSFMEMLKQAARVTDGAWELADGLRLPVTVVPRDVGAPPLWIGKKRPSHTLLTPTLIRTWQKRIEAGAESQNLPLFRSPSAKGHEPEKLLWQNEYVGPSREDAAIVGRLCHGVLETWRWGESTEVSAAVAQTAARLALDGGNRLQESAVSVLSNFFKSPGGQSLGKETMLARETPFLFAEKGTVVRGVIDLLYRRDGKLWVADYKTDRLNPGEALVRAQRYGDQGRDYREAIEKSLGEPCGFEIIFLRTGERVVLTE